MFTAHSGVIHACGRFLNPIGCSLHHALAIQLDIQVNPCGIHRLYSCRAFAWILQSEFYVVVMKYSRHSNIVYDIRIM